MRLLEAGFLPKNLFMIDIIPERVRLAEEKFEKSVNLYTGDASNMNMFPDKSFDVITTSTMWIQLTDDVLAKNIANEMLRVVSNSGKLIVFDWVYDFWQPTYKAVDNKRIYKLFDNISIDKKIKGQLVPPLGRFLSKYLPSSYFLVQKIPFVTGLYAFVITKKV